MMDGGHIEAQARWQDTRQLLIQNVLKILPVKDKRHQTNVKMF